MDVFACMYVCAHLCTSAQSPEERESWISWNWRHTVVSFFIGSENHTRPPARTSAVKQWTISLALKLRFWSILQYKGIGFLLPVCACVCRERTTMALNETSQMCVCIHICVYVCVYMYACIYIKRERTTMSLNETSQKLHRGTTPCSMLSTPVSFNSL